MLTGDELLAKVKEIAIEQSTKPLSKEQSIGRIRREMTETTITKQQLDKLWTALEYTRATIGPGGYCESKEHPGWVEIHKGRAHQSDVFLNAAIDLVNQLKKEIK